MQIPSIEKPRVLLAGDKFVTVDVLGRALEKAVPGAVTTSISSDWPTTPMQDVEEVHEACGDTGELIEALQGVHVCFTHTQPFTESVFEACPDLVQVTVCRGGPVNVNIGAATRHGVVVTSTPGRNAVATAEHTIAMIMAAVRQIPFHDAQLKRGVWEGDAYRYDTVGMEIRGTTVGVIGHGAVGSRVAAILAAMGARVLVHDPLVDPATLPSGVESVGSLADLLERSHIVTIHARVTEETKGMIGRDEISAMPTGSVLVNCARGPLLDYDAACDALDSGHLAAAAFDCLPQEPLGPDHRLTRTPRVVMTPHIGGGSKQAAEFAARVGSDDIARRVAGERPEHICNPDVLN